MDSEKLIEKTFCRLVSQAGGIALKFHSQLETGYPDRVCILPGGKTIWVEFKTTGEKPTRMQLYRHEQLRALGHWVEVVDSIKQARKLATIITAKDD